MNDKCSDECVICLSETYNNNFIETYNNNFIETINNNLQNISGCSCVMKYHANCFITWFTYKQVCPICNKFIPLENILPIENRYKIIQILYEVTIIDIENMEYISGSENDSTEISNEDIQEEIAIQQVENNHNIDIKVVAFIQICLSIALLYFFINELEN